MAGAVLEIDPNQTRPFTGRHGWVAEFELVDHLASGGIGDIHLARRRGVGGFERDFVLKLLPQSSPPDVVETFLDEARLLGLLHHHAIGSIYDAGLADGFYYMALEHVRGQDLATVLDTTTQRGISIPLDFALTATRAVASALDHAHRAADSEGRPLAIVHRGVSPANVVASYCGAIKLIDLGIAKATDQAPPDQRSDVYGVGALLYQLTTLRRYREQVRPSRLVHGYPLELEAIVMTALAKQPHARFACAAEVIDAIDRFAAAHRTALGEACVSHWLSDHFPRGVRQARQTRPIRLANGTLAPERSDDSETEPRDRVAVAVVDPPSGVATVRVPRQSMSATVRGLAAPAIFPRASLPSVDGLRPPNWGPPIAVIKPQRSAAPARRRLVAAVGVVGVATFTASVLITAHLLRPRSADRDPDPIAPAAGAPVISPPVARPVATVPPARAATERVAPARAALDVKLDVTSTPVGATVVLDGVRLGTTPLTITRPHGKRAALKLRAQGFWPTRQQVVFEASESMHVELARCPPSGCK